MKQMALKLGMLITMVIVFNTIIVPMDDPIKKIRQTEPLLKSLEYIPGPKDAAYYEKELEKVKKALGKIRDEKGESAKKRLQEQLEESIRTTLKKALNNSPTIKQAATFDAIINYANFVKSVFTSQLMEGVIAIAHAAKLLLKEPKELRRTDFNNITRYLQEAGKSVHMTENKQVIEDLEKKKQEKIKLYQEAFLPIDPQLSTAKLYENAWRNFELFVYRYTDKKDQSKNFGETLKKFLDTNTKLLKDGLIRLSSLITDKENIKAIDRRLALIETALKNSKDLNEQKKLNASKIKFKKDKSDAMQRLKIKSENLKNYIERTTNNKLIEQWVNDLSDASLQENFKYFAELSNLGAKMARLAYAVVNPTLFKNNAPLLRDFEVVKKFIEENTPDLKEDRLKETAKIISEKASEEITKVRPPAPNQPKKSGKNEYSSEEGSSSGESGSLVPIVVQEPEEKEDSSVPSSLAASAVSQQSKEGSSSTSEKPEISFEEEIEKEFDVWPEEEQEEQEEKERDKPQDIPLQAKEASEEAQPSPVQRAWNVVKSLWNKLW